MRSPSPGRGGQQPEGDLAEVPEGRSKEGLSLQSTSVTGLWEAGPASLPRVQNTESAQAPGARTELGQPGPPTSCCFQPRGWRARPGEQGAGSKGLASSPAAPSDRDGIRCAPAPGQASHTWPGGTVTVYQNLGEGQGPEVTRGRPSAWSFTVNWKEQASSSPHKGPTQGRASWWRLMAWLAAGCSTRPPHPQNLLEVHDT